MPAHAEDALARLSDALVARAAAAGALVACVHAAGSGPRSGTLWRSDVVVASEQVFPKTERAEIVFASGRRVAARVAGRDRGTNLVALRLDQPVEAALPAAAAPRLGEIALAFSAGAGGDPMVRLGVVRGVGPAWHSLNGGRIDQRISLDLALSRAEEGGPAVAVAGGLFGMTTAGPRGQALVIPAATVERVLDPLLAHGRIERGWLGVALHPVALPDAARAELAKTEFAQERGLMVMQVAPAGPAAAAGVLAGDILVAVDALPASHPRAISRQFGADSIGKAVALRLLRSGAALTLTATVTARPAG
ncbi:MAG: S1C family serine protease [Alphaproteobacteria bacterium]